MALRTLLAGDLNSMGLWHQDLVGGVEHEVHLLVGACEVFDENSRSAEASLKPWAGAAAARSHVEQKHGRRQRQLQAVSLAVSRQCTRKQRRR